MELNSLISCVCFVKGMESIFFFMFGFFKKWNQSFTIFHALYQHKLFLPLPLKLLSSITFSHLISPLALVLYLS